MAGTRNWLGSSSRLRAYGDRSTYGSQTWKRKPAKPLAELGTPSSFGQAREGAANGQGGESSRGVFDILSDDSDNESSTIPPRSVSFGGGAEGRGGGGNDKSNSGGGRVRPRTAMATANSSRFDVDDWSDSSNERPVKHSSRTEKKTKGARVRVPTCQLQSLTSSKGGARGGGAGSSDDGVAAKSTLDKRGRRSRSPSPPPASRENNSIGRSFGQANGGITSRPPPDASKSKEVFESRVGVGPQRSAPTVAAGQEGRGRGAAVGAAAAAAASRGAVKRAGGARRVDGKGASRNERGLAEKATSRSVFDMDEESD